jgi:hypothetical protein
VIAAGLVAANVEDVDDRWKDSILGYGLAAEEVCHPPDASVALASRSRQQ